MEGDTGKGTSLGAAITSICRYADLQDTKVLAARSCPILWDPLDCSPPGSSVHGICQARILEWVAIPFSKGSSQSRDQIHLSCIFRIGRQILYNLSHQGSPPGYKHTYKCTLTCRHTQLPPDLPLCRNLLGLPHRAVLQSYMKVILGTRHQQPLCPEHYITCSLVDLGLPRWLSRKESICNEGDAGSILGQEDPLE